MVITALVIIEKNLQRVVVYVILTLIFIAVVVVRCCVTSIDMIVNVLYSCRLNVEETISTLKFADRAKQVSVDLDLLIVG